MGKHILGVVVGLMVWFAAVVLAGVLLRSWVARVRRRVRRDVVHVADETHAASIGALTTFAAGR